MIGTLESGRARQNNRFCALCTPTGFDSLGAIELEKQIRCWVYFPLTAAVSAAFSLILDEV